MSIRGLEEETVYDPTLHHTGVIGRKADAILGDLNMDLGREANALEELMKLSGRTGDGAEQGWRRGVRCHGGDGSDGTETRRTQFPRPSGRVVVTEQRGSCSGV